MSDRLIRPAVRGLVIDRDDCVLMVKLVFPEGAWWVLPGGGIDAGESALDALHRELREETGLEDVPVGPVVWNRIHHFRMTDTDGRVWDGQEESVYLVRTERFDPAPHFTVDELHRENLHEHRWWSIADLLAYDGTDHFSPPDLASYLHVIVRDGAPDVPFSIVQSSQ